MLALALPTHAFAECDESWPSRCAVAVRAGEKAPFDGQLLTPDLAIDLGQRATAADARIAIEISRTSSLAEARRVRDLREAAADRKVVEAEREFYKRQADRPFFEHPLVVATVTAIAVVSLFVVVKKIDQATQ